MTAELDAFKDLAKNLVEVAVAGLAAGAGAVGLHRRTRRPLSIAEERFSISKEEWSELVSKVNAMHTTVELHAQQLERVDEDRAHLNRNLEQFTTTLGGLRDIVVDLKVQIARIGVRPA
jgi:hypothetical protein